MEAVILLGGAPGVDSADWADSYLDHLRRGFRSLGLDACHFRSNADGARAREAEYQRRGIRYFLLDINGGVGVDWPEAPFFSWIGDHPLTHPHLARAGRSMVLGMVDAGHARLQGVGAASRHFVPHGGPQDHPAPPTLARDLDVVFSGNILIDTRIPIAELIGAPDPLPAIATAAVARILDSDAEPLAALLAALADHGLDMAALGGKTFGAVLGLVIDYCQCDRRFSILRRLAGTKTWVMGKMLPSVAARLDGAVTVLGEAPFDRFLELSRRAHFVLNISHKFPEGSHERVWYGLSCGAAVVSSRSSFLQSEFTPDLDMLFYDHDQIDAARLRHAIGSGEALDMAAEAQGRFLRRHTWTARAGQIVALMRAAQM